MSCWLLFEHVEVLSGKPDLAGFEFLIEMEVHLAVEFQAGLEQWHRVYTPIVTASGYEHCGFDCMVAAGKR